MTNHTGREAMAAEEELAVKASQDLLNLGCDIHPAALRILREYLFAAWSRRADSEGAAPSIGQSIHYPECWDTAAYPTVESALSEMYAWFKCSTCKPSEAAVAAPVELPPLPEPAGAIDIDLGPAGPEYMPGARLQGVEDGYSADQMREYGIACRSASVVQASLTDELSKICEAERVYQLDRGCYVAAGAAQTIKTKIEALLAAQTKTPHGLPSDLPINQGVRATDSGEVK